MPISVVVGGRPDSGRWSYAYALTSRLRFLSHGDMDVRMIEIDEKKRIMGLEGIIENERDERAVYIFHGLQRSKSLEFFKNLRSEVVLIYRPEQHKREFLMSHIDQINLMISNDQGMSELGEAAMNHARKLLKRWEGEEWQSSD